VQCTVEHRAREINNNKLQTAEKCLN